MIFKKSKSQKVIEPKNKKQQLQKNEVKPKSNDSINEGNVEVVKYCPAANETKIHEKKLPHPTYTASEKKATLEQSGVGLTAFEYNLNRGF
eukprot:Pgem_evm1s13975